MQRLPFPQGGALWHQHRANARNASEAPAVLACSPYLTRAELLHQRHTGIRPEHGGAQQRRFDDGHAIEAAQRSGAAVVVGEPLYPVVGSEVIDGIELSASFDGLTMAEDVGYECKSLNDELRAALHVIDPDPDANDSRALPKCYRVQMEQQLMVCGGERILFVAANRDGTDVRRCWYEPDPALRAEILAGWRQFDVDLAAYVPPAAAAAAVIVAEPVQALPAVFVQVAGSITVIDNFSVFETAFRDFLEHRFIRTPQTDADFVNLDVQIKAMKGAEAALDGAEAQMLAQIQTVDAAKKTKEMLTKLVRDNRLMAEKLLASEKERRRGEIVAAGITALREHIAALNARLGRPLMPATATAADFGTSIRGKKSLASMEDAVAVTLANAKIAANEVADRAQRNLGVIQTHPEHAGLFADLAQLVLKDCDACAAIVGQRIAEHQAAEQRRATELAERERARIRTEEEARARAQAAREQQERADAEAADRRRTEDTVRAERNAEVARINAASAPAAKNLEPATEQPLPAGPGASVQSIRPTPAPAAPTLRLGQINQRIAPLSIDVAGLAALGFPHSATEGAARLWHEHQFPAIVAGMIGQLDRARQKAAA